MPNEITVIMVDDHAMIRQSIKSQIDAEPGMRVVGEGASGEDVMLLVVAHKPDVVLLDLHMPQVIGDDERAFKIMPTIRAIKKVSPQSAIVILSMDVSHILIETALRRGIQGYLLKEDTDATLHLPDVVRAVQHGTLISPKPSLTRCIQMIAKVCSLNVKHKSC